MSRCPELSVPRGEQGHNSWGHHRLPSEVHRGWDEKQRQDGDHGLKHGDAGNPRDIPPCFTAIISYFNLPKSDLVMFKVLTERLPESHPCEKRLFFHHQFSFRMFPLVNRIAHL